MVVLKDGEDICYNFLSVDDGRVGNTPSTSGVCANRLSLIFEVLEDGVRMVIPITENSNAFGAQKRSIGGGERPPRLLPLPRAPKA